jgi:hypothetical protein
MSDDSNWLFGWNLVAVAVAAIRPVWLDDYEYLGLHLATPQAAL